MLDAHEKPDEHAHRRGACVCSRRVAGGLAPNNPDDGHYDYPRYNHERDRDVKTMTESASDDLELLRSFVNTIDLETQIDQIDTPGRLRKWLAERSLLAVSTTVDEKAHHQALEFRETVRALALANGAAELDPAATTSFNELSSEASLWVAIGSDGQAELRPAGDGFHQAMGRLVSILYTAMVDGSFLRLKGCANDGCRWLFYDYSKNRSKKWCAMQGCGNMINARAYRQRRRHEPA
jgi:predicted RNA-binding Zn ribbon-like protein